jgi:tellurite resistance protein TehA-like permease
MYLVFNKTKVFDERTLQLYSFASDSLISMNVITVAMFENLQLVAYALLGFGVVYLALETAWHFTACRIQGGTLLKPCVFKQVKMAMISNRK